MSNKEFFGETGMIEQPKRRQWATDKGWSTVRVWEGAQKSSAEALAQQLTQDPSCSQADLSSDGASWNVTATFPDAQDPTWSQDQGTLNVTWELLGQDHEKDLKTHSSLLPDNDTERSDLAVAEKWVTSPEKDSADPTGNTFLPLPSTLCDKAKTYYKHRMNGTQAYLLARYVIRKMIKVTRIAGVQASLANVNKVETPDGCPLDLWQIPTDQGDGAIEWLKKPPTVTYLGKGKYSIAQEWWGGKWSTALYGGSQTP